MAKIIAPKPEAPKVATPIPTPDVPAPDISVLIANLEAPLQANRDAEEKSKSSLLDAIIVIREFRAENPTVERSDVKTAVQQAVANAIGVPLAKVQTAPDKANPKLGGDAYGYALSSAMLSTAWPKGEAEEKRVAKAIKDGKGFVEVRKAAAKPQANPGAGNNPDAKKITQENFALKFSQFLTQAQVDLAISMDDVVTMATKALEAIGAAPRD